MFKRIVYIGLILALLVSGALVGLSFRAAPAQAYHRWLNHHWARTANPSVLTYGTDVTATWAPLVDKVISEWDNVAQYRPGSYDVFNFVPSNNPKVFIESRNYGDTGWFGVATITRDIVTGHIQSGTVQVNDYYFTGQYNTTIARDHVLCQEVGHILGLDHNKVAPLFGASCMEDDNFTLNNPAYQTPNAHDAQQLNQIYNHSDSGLGSIIGSIPVGVEIIDIFPVQ